MKETNTIRATIAIDTKYYILRLHKSTLHQIGDPAYVQMLVNPDSRAVAVKSASFSSRDNQAHKIDTQLKKPGDSITIRAAVFIRKLMEQSDILKDGGLYHMHGSIIPAEMMAVFPLDTITKVTRKAD